MTESKKTDSRPAPPISVLMTAYNAADFILEAIDSILSQTEQDFEFLIIDDASTDRTWQIIQDSAEKDQRIAAFKNDQNLGIAANRNRLLARARGRYVAWQDADDVSLPERLARQRAFLDANPAIAIVGGQLRFIDQNGQSFAKNYPVNDAAIRKNIFRFNPISQPAAMARVRCLLEAGRYDERLEVTEDLDLLFRLGRRWQLANLAETVLIYRQHKKSSTCRRLALMDRLGREIRRRYQKDPAYHFNFTDRLHTFLYAISPYFIPGRLKIWLFNKWRNSKNK